MSKANLIALITLFCILGVIGGVNAQTNVDACTVISSPGYYILTQDILNSSTTCVEIISNDVIFDGNGHVIDGNGSGYGVYVHDAGNITLKNLEVTEWIYGV